MSVKVIHEAPPRQREPIIRWHPPKQPKHHSETQGVYQKVRKQTGVGKGDKPRPVNNKLYNENFDTINWKKKNERMGNRRKTVTRANN